MAVYVLEKSWIDKRNVGWNREFKINPEIKLLSRRRADLKSNLNEQEQFFESFLAPVQAPPPP